MAGNYFSPFSLRISRRNSPIRTDKPFVEFAERSEYIDKVAIVNQIKVMINTSHSIIP